MRCQVAQNPNASEAILRELAKDEFSAVELVLNPSLPGGLLEPMSRKRGKFEQSKLAGNRETPWQVLKYLSGPLSMQIARCTEQTMRDLETGRMPAEETLKAASEGLWSVRLKALSSSSLSPEQREHGLTALWREVGEAIADGRHDSRSAVLSGNQVKDALDRLELLPSESARKAIAEAAKSRGAMPLVAAEVEIILKRPDSPRGSSLPEEYEGSLHDETQRGKRRPFGFPIRRPTSQEQAEAGRLCCRRRQEVSELRGGLDTDPGGLPQGLLPRAVTLQESILSDRLTSLLVKSCEVDPRSKLQGVGHPIRGALHPGTNEGILRLLRKDSASGWRVPLHCLEPR